MNYFEESFKLYENNVIPSGLDRNVATNVVEAIRK